MPRITETTKEMLAHCRDPLCAGYAQRPVDGIETLQQWFFKEDGDPSFPLPGIEEKSSYTLRFAKEEDRPCPVCGESREISDQERPVYEAVSGYSQRESIHWIRNAAFKPDETRSARVEAALTRLEEALRTP